MSVRPVGSEKAPGEQRKRENEEEEEEEREGGSLGGKGAGPRRLMAPYVLGSLGVENPAK